MQVKKLINYAKLPPFLTIILRRFHSKRQKINYKCNVNSRIKIQLGGRETQNFVLSSLVEHFDDTADMGHYLAIAKTRVGYKKFDDNRVMNLNYEFL